MKASECAFMNLVDKAHKAYISKKKKKFDSKRQTSKQTKNIQNKCSVKSQTGKERMRDYLRLL